MVQRVPELADHEGSGEPASHRARPALQPAVHASTATPSSTCRARRPTSTRRCCRSRPSPARRSTRSTARRRTPRPASRWSRASTNGAGQPAPGCRPRAQTVASSSQGLTQVNNPAYDQNNLGTPTADRRGAEDHHARLRVRRDDGQVLFVSRAGTPFASVEPVAPMSWTIRDHRSATGTCAAWRHDRSAPQANGNKTPRGVTLHVGGHRADGRDRRPRARRSIQAAIDAATTDGDLITVGAGRLRRIAHRLEARARPGLRCAGSTVVNASTAAEYCASRSGARGCATWCRDQGMADGLLAGQTVPANMAACLTGDTVDNAPLLFATEESSGFFVLQRGACGQHAGVAPRNRRCRSTASPSPALTPAAPSSPTATRCSCRSPTTASPATRASSTAASASATRHHQ